jgi:hypothetical protein
MGETARMLGKHTTTIEYGGKSYTLSEQTYDIIAFFESWAEEQALRKARRMRDVLPPDEAASYWEETVKQVNSGCFTHGRKELANLATSTAGMIETLRLMLLEHHRGDPDIANGKIPTAIIREQLQAYVDALAILAYDPNRQAPGTPGPSGPSPMPSPISAASPGTSDLGRSDDLPQDRPETFTDTSATRKAELSPAAV